MTINCKVQSVKPLTTNTFQILLTPETTVNYQAGQYLFALMGEDDKRPFSIASSPLRQQGNELELHIGGAEQNSFALEVIDMAKKVLEKEDYSFEITAPFGNAWFQEKNDRPLLLIAGGTGFSYVRSILDYCLNINIKQPIFLYWGGRDIEQLYANAELESLDLQQSHFTYVPVVENASSDWQGKKGNVLEAVMADFVTLSSYDIYIAGPFAMAGAAREMFCKEKGADPNHLFSDAYSFI